MDVLIGCLLRTLEKKENNWVDEWIVRLCYGCVDECSRFWKEIRCWFLVICKLLGYPFTTHKVCPTWFIYNPFTTRNLCFYDAGFSDFQITILEGNLFKARKCVPLKRIQRRTHVRRKRGFNKALTTHIWCFNDTFFSLNWSSFNSENSSMACIEPFYNTYVHAVEEIPLLRQSLLRRAFVRRKNPFTAHIVCRKRPELL